MANKKDEQPESPTLMELAAIVSSIPGVDPAFGPAIILGRGHGKHSTEQAQTVGEVLKDEVNTLLGKTEEKA